MRPRNTILVGDAATRLAQLDTSSIDCVITSPPYFRLRDYQHPGQLGLEATVKDWVEGLRPVMAEVARVLVPTGTVWLNLGETYSTHPHQGANPKSLLLGPERLALALIEDGWTVRNRIIWAKTNPIPSSVTDRLSTTHEVIYLLTRSRRYFFDLDAIREPPKSGPSRPPTQPRRPPRGTQPPRTRGGAGVPRQWLGPNTDTDDGLIAMKRKGISSHPLGKNPGDVWRMATSSFKGEHFATYPERLVERVLLAGCPERRCRTCRTAWYRPLRRLGATATRLALRPDCTCSDNTEQWEPGLVLDPFIGSGTTGIVAHRHHRDWLGIELHPDFAELAGRRIQTADPAASQHQPSPRKENP